MTRNALAIGDSLVVDIASFPVSKAFDRELWPSLWIIFGAQELGEFLIRRKDLVVNRLCALIGQTLFVCVGKFRRKFLGGFKERVRRDDAVALAGQLIEHELGRHQSIFFALAHHLSG